MGLPVTGWLSVLAGALVGCGAFVAALGLRRVTRARPVRQEARSGARDRLLVQAAVGVLVGLIVLLLTGWPVGTVLLGAIAASLPAVFGGRAARQAEIARAEAIATWTGQLRDVLRGGSGLLDSIEASAARAPGPIRPQVERLALGMRRGQLVPALRAFAADVDDPMANLVVASLIVAATEQVGHLGDLLGMLAERTTERVRMRMRIERDRASIRTQVRGVVLVTLICMGGMAAFNRGLLAAYDSATGQLALAVIGSCFLAGFALLARLARPQTSESFVLARARETA